MAIEPSVPHTRRAVLAAALGGVAATVASAIGRPLAVHAADGQTVVVGGEYDSSSPTKIANGSSGDAGIALWGASPASVGVYGSSTSNTGVIGESNSSYGVRGFGSVAIRGDGTTIGLQGVTSAGTGVEGNSGSGYAVHGASATGVGVRASGGAIGVQASSTNGPGVEAVSTSASGVVGMSLSGSGLMGVAGDQLPPTQPKTGVYGYAVIDANSRGVWGFTQTGQGVRGEATSGQGVRGEATNGRGVHGNATSGVGVRATAGSGTGVSAEATTGYALRTKGRIRFDNSSGIATIASGTSSIVVTPGVDLTATSAVVATLNGDAGGATTVKRVSINTTANTFTIFLTANAAASVKLAWIVVG